MKKEQLLFTSGMFFEVIVALSCISSAETFYKNIQTRLAHKWSFDLASELFLVADSVTGVQSTVGGIGAKLQSNGLRSRNNFLTLQGTGASLNLGRFVDCCGDSEKCSAGLTISFWLRFRNGPGVRQYFVGNKDVIGSAEGFVISRDRVGKMNVNFKMKTFSVNMAYPAPPQKWVHHLITWNGDRMVAVYLDGQQLVKANNNTGRSKRDTAASTTKSPKELNMLRIGHEKYLIDADFDELAIWDEAISEKDAAAVYTSVVATLNIYRDCRSNASSICIYWKMPEDHFNAVTALSVLYQKAGAKLINTQPSSKSVTSTCVSGLEPLSSYSLWVEVVLKHQKEFRSEKVTCTTTDGIPNPPSDLTAKSDGPTSASVTWKAPSIPNALIVHFIFCVIDVYDGKVIVNTTQNYVGANSEYNFKIPGITGRTYRMTVRSVGKMGVSEMKTIDVTMLVEAPKRNVSGLKVTKITWESISLSWKPLAGYEIASSVVYKIDVSAVDLIWKKSVIANGTNTTIHGMKENDVYSINIRAVSSMGHGPPLDIPIYAFTPDYNECADPWDNLCDANADCLDTNGSYFCLCKGGFYGDGYRCRAIPSHAGEGVFCSSQTHSTGIIWPRIYNGETAIIKCPTGSTGFATNYCQKSSSSQRAFYYEADLSGCVSHRGNSLLQKMKDPRISAFTLAHDLWNATQSHHLFGGDIINSITYIPIILKEKLKLDNTTTSPSEIARDLVGVGSNLLEILNARAWKDIPKLNRTLQAEELMKSMDVVADFVSENLSPSQSFISKQNNIDFIVSRSSTDITIKMDSFSPNTTQLQPAGKKLFNSIILPVKEHLSNTGQSDATASFVMYKNINDLLEKPITSHKHNDGHSSSISSFVNSQVMSVTVIGVDAMKFTKKPLQLSFQHSKPEKSINTSCVYWDESKSTNGEWSSEGCFVNKTGLLETTCHCYHLTSFAVLMTVSDIPMTPELKMHASYLRIISYVCLFISLAALILALLSFMIFRFLQSPRVVYHKNLVVALILANGLFIFGIERTENAIVCKVIAILLHYFFLVAFVWMAMEGLMLYFMLKKIFSDRKFMKGKLCQSLCWIVPALYVGVLAGIKQNGYGTSDFCWLSTVDGFIWAFVGPIVVILMMNVIVMAQAFCVMAQRKKSKDLDVARETWYWLKGCNVLTCLLGITWIFGLFYVNGSTIVFAYLFNICNALQGLFIFIFHCLIDSRVRAEYCRILKCQPRHEYNEKAGYTSSLRFRKFSNKSASNSMDRSASSYGGKKRRQATTDRDKDRNANESATCEDYSQSMPLTYDENISMDQAASSCSEAHSDSHPLLPMASTPTPELRHSQLQLQNDSDEPVVLTFDDLPDLNESENYVPDHQDVPEICPRDNTASTNEEQSKRGSHVPLRHRFSLESLCKETYLADRGSIHFERLKEGSIESLFQQTTITDTETTNLEFLERLEKLSSESNNKRPLRSSRSRPFDENTISPLSIIQEPSSESLNTIKSTDSLPSSPTSLIPHGENDRSTLKIEVRRTKSLMSNKQMIVVDFKSLKEEGEKSPSAGGIHFSERVSNRPPSLWMEQGTPNDKFLKKEEKA